MNKTQQNRADMMNRIETHGKTLLAIFPDAREQDPVKLCKALRRIETAASKAAVNYCNGHIDSDRWEFESALIWRNVGRLLEISSDSLEERGFFVNGDPRGYALKLKDSWTTGFNNARREQGLPELHRDWGGYGILAPDLAGR